MNEQCTCEKDKEPTLEMKKCFEKNFSASMKTCDSFYTDTGCVNYIPSNCHDIGYRSLLYILYGSIAFYTAIAIFFAVFVMNKLKIQKLFILVVCAVIFIISFFLAKSLNDHQTA